MTVQNEAIILRPLEKGDIPDRIHWETVEAEWQLWDGPWDYESKTETQRAEDLEDCIRCWEGRLSAPPKEGLATQFEICANDENHTHVGWCGGYTIDEDCCISDEGSLFAIGVCIPPMSARRKGYASAALKLYIQYFREHGVSEVYTQTWSGNIRMIALAEKLGFVECRRKPGLRTVRGEAYDGLTFCLKN